MSESIDLTDAGAEASGDATPVEYLGRSLRFEGMTFDPQNLELTRDGERVMLQPLPGRMLVLLIRNRSRIVSKEELRSALWSGTFVSDSAISSTLRDLRRAVKDEGQHQRVIRTYRGRGYRFAAPLESDESANFGFASPRPSLFGLDATTTEAAADVPFVGCISELEQLDRRLQRTTRDRQGGFVLIEGMLGSGKSALLEQFSRQLSDSTVVRHQCKQELWKPPMETLGELLADLSDGPGGFEPREGPRIARLPDARRVARSRERTRDSRAGPNKVVQVLESASEIRPVIILIDDLHFADEGSVFRILDLIGFLEAKGILVVATAELGLLSGRVLEALGSLGGKDRLALSGLSLSHVERLAHAVMARPPETSWLRSLHYNTDGSTGATLDLMRCAARLEPSLPSVAELPLPEPLSMILRSRLAHLPSDTRHLIVASTVLPPDTDLATLTRVAGLEKVGAEALEAGILGGWFLPGGWTHQVRIRSPFLRRVVLSAVSADRRRQIDFRAVREDSESDHERGRVFSLEPNSAPAPTSDASRASPPNSGVETCGPDGEFES